MQTITVSAPGKLMLFGEYAVLEGQPCIVVAINHRMHMTVTKTDRRHLVLQAKDLGIHNYEKSLDLLGKGDIPRDARFVEIAFAHFIKQYGVEGGIRVETQSSFSGNVGFGSSAAVVVCLLFALVQLYNLHLEKKELFDLAYQVVLDAQGIGSGFDIASALYGGMVYFTLGGKIIEPIEISELPLLVGYTGKKADTAMLVHVFEKAKEHNSTLVNNVCEEIGSIVLEAHIAIQEKNWQHVGELMNTNHELVSQLGTTTQELEKLILAARAAGAYGAKLSGAGGGDCMIAIVPDDKKITVENAITESGGTVMPVSLEKEGVRRES